MANPKVPAEVLQRARVVLKAATPTARPAPTAAPKVKVKANAARTKVVAALKRLHPMD